MVIMNLRSLKITKVEMSLLSAGQSLLVKTYSLILSY
jgi:hypothetical protein